MPKFYFTYGSEGMDFVGGWTEVDAPNYSTACELFSACHAKSADGLINCAGIYSEREFAGTKMCQKGSNLGAGCHEVISLKRILTERSKNNELI